MQPNDRDSATSGWFEELFRQFTRTSEIDVNRRPDTPPSGVTMRPPPAMQCTNYLAYEHSALKPMVTQDVDPEQLGTMSDLYTRAGNAMVKFSDDVAAAVGGSQGEWQGAAADAARKFMADTGNWIGHAGESAKHAGTQLAQQSAALTEAKNSMPDEKPFDYDAAMADLRSTTDPVAYATKAAAYVDEYQASRAAHEAAARVVSAYDGRLEAASTMPAFAPPPTVGGADELVGRHGSGVDRGTVGVGPTTPGAARRNAVIPAQGNPDRPRVAGHDSGPSSYLIDADAYGVFGTGESTAPPVIG